MASPARALNDSMRMGEETAGRQGAPRAQAPGAVPVITTPDPLEKEEFQSESESHVLSRDLAGPRAQAVLTRGSVSKGPATGHGGSVFLVHSGFGSMGNRR